MSITRRNPAARSSIASQAEDLIGSARSNTPAGWPSIATEDDRVALLRNSSAWRQRGGPSTPASSEETGVAEQDCASLDVPDTPARWNGSLLGRADLSRRSSAPATMAAARGCSLAIPRQAARRRTSSGANRRLPEGLASPAFPRSRCRSCPGPTVSTLARVSRVSASRTSTPAARRDPCPP